MTAVVSHLEGFCGPIAEGWKFDPDGNEMQFQVVRFQHGPTAGTVTFSTLGLSNYPLKSPDSEKAIRHELIMLARDGAVPANFPAVLQQVGAEAITRASPYLRGEIVGPRGILFSGAKMTALYVSNPVYFPDEFFSTPTPTIGRVIFAWLIPITGEEANYVASNGWPKFEDLLIREDPDLLDFHRPSAVK